ncbi:DNA repair protein RecO [Chloroflexota bacterium]
MTKPRNYKTEAVIIKKTKLGEADRILTLYTPRLGKIQAVAKGVRRPRSKLSGHLELLTHSQVSFARGKNLDTITGSQTINSFFKVKNDLVLVSYALYISELVNKFTEDHIEDYPLFNLLLEALHNLGQSGDNELTLRCFELHLLDHAGYRPQLQHCVTCHFTLKSVTGSFSLKAGGILCPKCSYMQPTTINISNNCLRLLRLLQDSGFCILPDIEVKAPTAHEAEWIIRSYIRYLLERDIKSTAWLDSLKHKQQKGQIALL